MVLGPLVLYGSKQKKKKKKNLIGPQLNDDSIRCYVFIHRPCRKGVHFTGANTLLYSKGPYQMVDYQMVQLGQLIWIFTFPVCPTALDNVLYFLIQKLLTFFLLLYKNQGASDEYPQHHVFIEK